MKNTSKISYDALQVEGLKEVLAQVSSACDELGIHFFIVGAIARNVWFAAHDEKPNGTRDIDFAVYIPGKEEYQKLKENLLGNRRAVTNPYLISFLYFQADNFIIIEE